jgi:hypothetical protein
MTNNEEGSTACIALRATKHRPVILDAAATHVLIVKYDYWTSIF